MGRPLNPQVLRAHADFIEQKIAGLRRLASSNDDLHRRADFLVRDLVTEHGARHRYYGGTYMLQIAGLQTSCTSGSLGLLSNWVSAARRKIEVLEV